MVVWQVAVVLLEGMSSDEERWRVRRE